MYLVILVILVILIRCQFWNRQPIRHIYDFPTIINAPPLFNKYCDTTKVIPSSNLISIYLPLQGCITSRKVDFTMNGPIPAYFTEINADSTSIYRTLFQTHIYMLHKNTNIGVHLFTSDKRIAWLVPITRYPIHWNYTGNFKKYISIKYFTQVTPNSLYEVYQTLKKPFTCQMVPSLEGLNAMIVSKTLSIFYYLNPHLIAIFFFNNSYPNLDWIATIHITTDPIHKAISSFLYSIRKTFSVVRIHTVSHTPSYKGFKQTELCYYAYNYGISRIAPKNCLFI